MGLSILPHAFSTSDPVYLTDNRPRMSLPLWTTCKHSTSLSNFGQPLQKIVLNIAGHPDICGSFQSQGWVQKSQIRKVPHLRKSNKLFKIANLRIFDLRNLFADRPPLIVGDTTKELPWYNMCDFIRLMYGCINRCTENLVDDELALYLSVPLVSLCSTCQREKV